MNQEHYKKDEIKEHFDEFLVDQDKEWIEENIDDIHHHAFNTDYYIIGTYEAKQWLGDPPSFGLPRVTLSHLTSITDNQKKRNTVQLGDGDYAVDRCQ